MWGVGASRAAGKLACLAEDGLGERGCLLFGCVKELPCQRVAMCHMPTQAQTTCPHKPKQDNTPPAAKRHKSLSLNQRRANASDSHHSPPYVASRQKKRNEKGGCGGSRAKTRDVEVLDTAVLERVVLLKGIESHA